MDKMTITAMAKGDPLAFRKVYDHFAPNLLRDIRRVFQQDAEVCADIIQSVFQNVWKYRAKFLNIDDPQIFIFVMAKNEMKTHLRREALRMVAQEEFRYQTAIPDKSTDPDLELLPALRKAIDSLYPQQKAVVKLRLEGLDHMQIAKRMNLSTATINNHAVAANKSLRKRLRS